MRTILMTRPFQRPLLGCIALLAGVFALTGGALASGSPASSRAADNPTQAVRALIHGYYDGPQGQRMPVPGRFANCFPNPLRAADCPVTPRFLHRLQHPDPIPPRCQGGCTLDLVSRSQNTTQYLSVRLADNNGSVVHVNTRWGYAYSAMRFTFVVRHSGGGWQVDDEYCTGHPETTIYQVPVRPCP